MFTYDQKRQIATEWCKRNHVSLITINNHVFGYATGNGNWYAESYVNAEEENKYHR